MEYTFRFPLVAHRTNSAMGIPVGGPMIEWP